MRGIQCSFPDLALLQFAVPVQAVDPAVLAIQLGLGCTTGDAEPLPQELAANAWKPFLAAGWPRSRPLSLRKVASSSTGNSPGGTDAVPDRTDVPVGQKEQILSATVHGPVRRIDGHLLK